MTAIHDMSDRRLKAELVIAEGLTRTHRQGIAGSCHERICPEKWPCRQYKRGLATVDSVSAEMARRKERLDRIAQARVEWQQPG